MRSGHTCHLDSRERSRCACSIRPSSQSVRELSLTNPCKINGETVFRAHCLSTRGQCPSWSPLFLKLSVLCLSFISCGAHSGTTTPRWSWHLPYKQEKEQNRQGNACFSTGNFLPRLLALSLTPANSDEAGGGRGRRHCPPGTWKAQAQPGLGSSLCPPACPLWERRPSSRSMGPPAWEAVCSATPSHLYLNPLHGLCLENSNVCFAGRVRTEAETCQRQRRPGVREPVSSSGWQGGQRWALGWNLQAWPCQFALGLGRGVSVLGQLGGVGEGAEATQLGWPGSQPSAPLVVCPGLHPST